jgi:uncharacterized damage-inducible protein DinB
MYRLLTILFLAALLPAQTPPKKARTLREVLLDQLSTSHDRENWYAPIKKAVEGVTPEQARWTDGHGNHSIGQLVNHLAFWNERSLAQFQGKKVAAYKGDNEDTFNNFDAAKWTETVERLDRVMKDWETAVEQADDARLADAASGIANISAHNAYHVGQIIYVRRAQGSWNPAKGAK